MVEGKIITCDQEAEDGKMIHLYVNNKKAIASVQPGEIGFMRYQHRVRDPMVAISWGCNQIPLTALSAVSHVTQLRPWHPRALEGGCLGPVRFWKVISKQVRDASRARLYRPG